MKKLKDKQIIAVVVGFVVVILLGFVLIRSGGSKKSVSGIREVSVRSGGNTFKVKANGLVEFFGADGSTDEQFWGRDKTTAFFDYIKNHADLESTPSSYTVTIDGVTYYISLDDELLGAIFEEFGVEPESSNELGEIFDDYFSSPTPSQVPAGGSTPTPTGGGTGGGGGDEGICPYWKVGFCIYPTPAPFSQPTPVATPTTIPVEICDLIDTQITTRTVVSNTLCLEDPE